MKTEYPLKYESGSIGEIEKKLSINNKKILNDYLNFCLTTAGKNKVDKIKRVIIQLYDLTETDLDKQTKETINGFLVLLNQSNKAGWTKHETKVYVKKFLKWYYKDFSLIENIKSTKRDKQTQINENDLLTQEEFDKLLKTANTPFKKVVLSLLYETGCRPQELLNLHWKEVKFEEDYTNISFYSNKTGETRTFPAVKSKEILWNWKQNYPYENPKGSDLVFPSPRDRNKPLDSATLNKMLKTLAKESGINKDVWNYLLRHTRLTKLYEELPQQIVEKLAGHKNMAGVYAHISQKKARDELLNKVYHIEELKPSEKNELQKLKKDFIVMKEKLDSYGEVKDLIDILQFTNIIDLDKAKKLIASKRKPTVSPTMINV